MSQYWNTEDYQTTYSSYLDKVASRGLVTLDELSLVNFNEPLKIESIISSIRVDSGILTDLRGGRTTPGQPISFRRNMKSIQQNK